MVVMTEGQLGLFEAKTAASVIRYRRQDVVAVLDSERRELKRFDETARGSRRREGSRTHPGES